MNRKLIRKLRKKVKSIGKVLYSNLSNFINFDVKWPDSAVSANQVEIQRNPN